MFYAEALRLTRETGIRHEVDHIYPLQSDVVCGLHCEANLRVITKFQNQSKKNRMPDASAARAFMEQPQQERQRPGHHTQ